MSPKKQVLAVCVSATLERWRVLGHSGSMVYGVWSDGRTMRHSADTYAERRNDKRGMPAIIRDAMAECGDDARKAEALFETYCAVKPRRVPGVDTVMRLAVSLWLGRSIEEVAAREYVYRFSIAHNGRAFAPPHTIGM